jgi:hypothetical protein
MGSPRPVRAGTAAEDSDWEPSDGEEGDSPPLYALSLPFVRRRCRWRGGVGWCEADVAAAPYEGGDGRGCWGGLWCLLADAGSPLALGQRRHRRRRPPADDERAASETRDGFQATNRTRQPSKFLPRSSPFP